MSTIGVKHSEFNSANLAALTMLFGVAIAPEHAEIVATATMTLWLAPLYVLMHVFVIDVLERMRKLPIRHLTMGVVQSDPKLPDYTMFLAEWVSYTTQGSIAMLFWRDRFMCEIQSVHYKGIEFPSDKDSADTE